MTWLLHAAPTTPAWGIHDWFRSSWFRLTLGGVLALATWAGVSTGAPFTYILGQIVLGLSVYLSLFLLANRPLINPIQAFVGVFYWWFGVAPMVEAIWNLMLGRPDTALHAQVAGMESLWVVAPGLLLYAVVARLTFRWFSKKRAFARFLLPRGDNYRPRVLIIYLSIIGLALVMLAGLKSLGIQGQEETSFFGGTKTTIWWVGVIAAIGSIAPFVSSSLLMSAASPWKALPFKLKVLIGILVAQTIVTALFGGWKGPLAFLGAYYIFAYISKYQRPPWLFITIGSIFFVLVIAPYVSFGRQLALTSGAENSVMRKQVFMEVLKNPKDFMPTVLNKVEVSVFFRGIYPLAGELTRRNGLIDGEWHGLTILWGFETLIPRPLYPGKRDSNIGNFFARTVGADIGASDITDTLNNIAISIPFEFLGNFGWGMGILSFALIGFFWTLFVSWILSPSRLDNHPLTPFLTLSVMGMESSLGSFLAGIRELIIPLCICYVVYRLMHKKI